MSDINSAYELVEKDIQYLTRLLEIIEIQDWEAFGSIIVGNPKAFQSFARLIMRSAQLNGMTILHACARNNPPSFVVHCIHELVPESLTYTDFSRRTPLHVAVGMEAGLSTIETLLELYPDACYMQDIEGKTPLHLACDASCKLFESNLHDLNVRIPRFNVIRTLIYACPESVALEDKVGMSPLEYAILSDAPIKVVELLQFATREQCELRIGRDLKRHRNTK